MVGWHHQLDGHGFGWTPGVGDGQGGLVCCSPWGRKESDRTEQLNRTEQSLEVSVRCLRGQIKLVRPSGIQSMCDSLNSHSL